LVKGRDEVEGGFSIDDAQSLGGGKRKGKEGLAVAGGI
jgi:hypothetical protein